MFYNNFKIIIIAFVAISAVLGTVAFILHFVSVKKCQKSKQLETFFYQHDDKIGFIILRHVNSKQTNKYWKKSYDCIRTFYPENKIVIIDDNSNYKFITDKKLYNTIIINSEFPKRGELLPYYYYLNNKFFDNAVIIHDSVFINTYIDFSVDTYRFLWHFSDHRWDKPGEEIRLLKLFHDEELIDFYTKKHLWNGCFGAMSIINHDFLVSMNNKYNLRNLLDSVLTRDNRMSFERVIACLLQKHGGSNKSLLGSIHKYCRWGIDLKQIDNYNHLPIIKVWTGR